MTPVLKEHRENEWRTSNGSKGLSYSFIIWREVGPFKENIVSIFECPAWNMKEQKVKPNDIFTFKPTHPSFYTRIRMSV